MELLLGILCSGYRRFHMRNLVKRGHWLHGVSKHIDDHTICSILRSYSEMMIERGTQEKSDQKSHFNEKKRSVTV